MTLILVTQWKFILRCLVKLLSYLVIFTVAVFMISVPVLFSVGDLTVNQIMVVIVGLFFYVLSVALVYATYVLKHATGTKA